MEKHFFWIIILLSLYLSSAVGAQEIFLTRYDSPEAVPRYYMDLMGGKTKVVGKMYHDDSGATRTDKKYYVLTHSYTSTLPVKDVLSILKPGDGYLQNLLDDTHMRPLESGFQVSMLIKTPKPFPDYDCTSKMSYRSWGNGPYYFNYHFDHFNMMFTDMVIQVEVKEENGKTRISLNQVLALRGKTFSKLRNLTLFNALGKFENHLKENIKIFKAGTGG